MIGGQTPFSAHSFLHLEFDILVTRSGFKLFLHRNLHLF